MPATAPYNFIRFVPPVTAKGLNGDHFELPPFDIDVPGLKTGYIDYTLTTLSPLHIGPDPVSLKTPDGKYFWIPGSAVRGMLRSVLEAVLGGDLDEPVLKAQHDQGVYYRAPLAANAAYKRAYWTARGGIDTNSQKVGLLRRGPGGYTITTGEPFKVRRDAVEVLLSSLAMASPGRPGPRSVRLNATSARDELQFRQVWFVAGPDLIAHRLEAEEFGGARRGWLLITGVFGQPTSQRHAYIIAEAAGARQLSASEKVITDYKEGRTDHTDALMPDLEKYFAAKPNQTIPVFFDADGQQVKRIGTAGGFRIRATKSLADTVDPGARQKGALLAVAALLGRVAADMEPEQVDPLPTIAARLRFGHAMADAANTRLLSAQHVRLDSPKLTATHLRLRDASSPTALRTFDSDVVAYRGRSIYLHRWDRTGSDELNWQEAVKEHAAGAPANAPAAASSEFMVQPVGSGTTFQGRIEFRNLTDAEFGALLFALNLWNVPGKPLTHAHKLGGLRPLGLGSVGVHVQVSLVDPRQRYSVGTGLRTITSLEVAQAAFGFAVRFASDGKPRGDQPAKWPSSPQQKAALDLERATRWEERKNRALTREMSVKEHAERGLLQTLQELFAK